VGLGGLLAAKGIQTWMNTLDYRAAFYDRRIDPMQGTEIPRIYLSWHENLLSPIYLRGHCHVSMLLSQHRDADILACVSHHLGYEVVRGSSYRGGAKAIRAMLTDSHKKHLGITPDGPRGPRRCLAMGAIYLASRLQLPIVAMGYGYDRPWRAKSWDRFAVPRPFSRARAIFSPPVVLPRHLGREEMEQYRQQVEQLLNDLSGEAEAWAEAGTRKAGEVTIRPQAAERTTKFAA